MWDLKIKPTDLVNDSHVDLQNVRNVNCGSGGCLKRQAQVVNHHLHSPGLDGGNLGAHTGLKSLDSMSGGQTHVEVVGQNPKMQSRTSSSRGPAAAQTSASYLDGSLGLLEFYIGYSADTGVDEEITRAFVQGQVRLEDRMPAKVF